MKLDVIEGEIWKPIEGIPNYYVSNMGRVRSEKSVIKPILNRRTGLTQCMTYIDSKPKLLNVQNVVGKHFLPPPPEENMMVRHISSDLLDNRVENLTWGYRGRIKNQENGINIEKYPRIVKSRYRYIIKQIAITGLVIATYVGFETLEKMGYKRHSIMQVSSGRYYKDTYKGYRWSTQKIKD